MADSACSSCHQDIDPMGFVLENFDPIGRWRTSYPSPNKRKKPQPVDAAGTMPNGTKLKDVTDLKKYLVENPEFFTNCIAEKLLTYATGRPLNYREKKKVEEICAKNIKNTNGFRALLMSLIVSDIFKAR